MHSHKAQQQLLVPSQHGERGLITTPSKGRKVLKRESMVSAASATQGRFRPCYPRHGASEAEGGGELPATTGLPAAARARPWVPPPRQGAASGRAARPTVRVGAAGLAGCWFIWIRLKFYSSVRKGEGGIFLCMKQKRIRRWTGLELKIIWANWEKGLEEAVSQLLGEWKILHCSSNAAPQGPSVGLTSSSSGNGSNTECESAMSRC